MIASLEGIIGGSAGDHVVLVVGGVGFKVFTPRGSISAGVGERQFLFTEMTVREDAITLYGFATSEERELFNRLTTVTGVGAKLALAILGTLSGAQIVSAIVNDQPDLLTRVPGVGKKVAEKIVFELRSKLKGVDTLGAAAAFNDVDKDILDALIGFGYSIAEAQAALNALPPDTPRDFDERMRRALQYFI